MRFIEHLLAEQMDGPNDWEAEEEFIGYNDAVATKLARQLLSGAKGDMETAEKLAHAFADTIVDAMKKEARFTGARVVGHGAPEQSQMNTRPRPTGYEGQSGGLDSSFRGRA